MSIKTIEVANQLLAENAQLKAEVARLNEQLQVMAAEGANMLNAIDQTIGWQESVDPENEESVRLLVDLKIPATNAILNEVRAQAVPPVLADVLAERQKQIAKGYTAEHDDEHCCDEIAAAATVLVMPEACRDWMMHPDLGFGETLCAAMLPADWGFMLLTDRRNNLIKGIAMLVAEVERLDRADAVEVKP